MLKLIRFLKGYRFKTIFGPIFKLIEAVCELITPLVVAWIIDTAIPRGQNGDYSGLIYGGIIILALAAAGLGFSLTAQYFASRASVGFGTNLRRDLYAHINTFSYTELDKFSTASLITRLTADVNQAQQAVAMFIRLILRAPFIVVGAIIMAMLIDVKLSLIFVAAALVIGGVLWIIMRLSVPGYKKVQSKLDDVSRLTRENLAGARVVRAFGAEEREKSAFDAAAESLSSASIKVGALSSFLNPVTYAVLNLAVIAILWFGGKTVYMGELSQGQIIALVNYMTQILNAMVVFANLLVTFTKASASAARINEVFEVKTSMQEGAGATADLNSPAAEFENVSFSYAGNASHSLENINVKVLPGQSVGILGGTGSGKTTLINLLMRFYDADSGTIKVEGEDVTKVTRKSLRLSYGMVLQDTWLKKGTVRENIAYGRPSATQEEIEAAAKAAHIHNFIMRLPNGYDTVLGDDGGNISQGQKQLFCIARVMLAHPPMLILDEATSSIDTRTELKIQEAFEKLMKNKTSFIVAHRLSTIKNADLILVMNKGNVIEKGTHEELLEKRGFYYNLYNSQFEH